MSAVHETSADSRFIRLYNGGETRVSRINTRASPSAYDKVEERSIIE